MRKILFTLLFAIPALLQAQNEVQFVLSGALQPRTIRLRAKLTNNTSNTRAVLSTTNPPAAPYIYSNTTVANDSNNRMAAYEVSGLQPNTKYYYAIEADGNVDTSPDDIGTFTTPKEGPFSYTFMAGSCNRFPNTVTYDDFFSYNALFYLNGGDLHYANPCSQDVNVHRNAYETKVFTQSREHNVMQQLPLAYVWDDHDYCGNNAAGNGQAGTGSARKAFREYIPHYDLPAGTGNEPIYQSYTIGRVRFIMSDLRSEFVSGVTAMGATQKAWFKNEVIQARNNKQLICWTSSYSWYGTADDNWCLNPAERTELSEFFRDSSIENMFIINGDAHMLALDNGSNGDFTTAKNHPYRYPLIQAGPIQNNGSNKGGTYSEGTSYTFFVVLARYGVITIDDNGGDSVCVTMDGYSKDLTNFTTKKEMTYSFCRKLGNYVSDVKEHTQKPFIVYPNPSGGIFSLMSVADEDIAFSVFSAEGKLIKSSSLTAKGYCTVDIADQPGGVYFIKANTSHGTIQERVVISR